MAHHYAVMMTSTDFTLHPEDGYRLAASYFEPETSNGLLLQINGATGVPRGYYKAFAEFMASRGFSVLTYDYRGIGGSKVRPDGAPRPTMERWGTQDAAAASRWLMTRQPNQRLCVVGHSLGGQVLGLSPFARNHAAILLVASQHGYWRHWPQHRQLRLRFIWYLAAPLLLMLTRKLPGWLIGGEDLPFGVGRDWARWCRSPHYVCDSRGAPLRPHNSEIQTKIRAYSFSDDPIAPKAAVDALMAYYPNAERERHHINPAEWGTPTIGHFGFFRRTMPQSVWSEAADWLARNAVTHRH